MVVGCWLLVGRFTEARCSMARKSRPLLGVVGFGFRGRRLWRRFIAAGARSHKIQSRAGVVFPTSDFRCGRPILGRLVERKQLLRQNGSAIRPVTIYRCGSRPCRRLRRPGKSIACKASSHTCSGLVHAASRLWDANPAPISGVNPSGGTPDRGAAGSGTGLYRKSTLRPGADPSFW